MTNRLIRVVFVPLLSMSVIACKYFRGQSTSTREVPYKGQSITKQTVGTYAFHPSDSNCAGYPTLRIESMAGSCVGLVKQSDDPSFSPRVILEIPGRPNEFLISDFANWDNKNGKIWYLKTSGKYETTVMKPVLTGLSVPHQLAVGPENHIFFAEDSRIKAFPLSAIQGTQPIPSSAVVDMIVGLPPMISNGQKNSMHPIKHFVFDSKFNIYINIGAYTDHCSDFKGRDCFEADISFGNSGTSDIREHGAVVRKYEYSGALSKKWDPRYSIIAMGLRNSMGLLFTPAGDLIQVENGRDFNESTRPFEELNIIQKSEIDRLTPPKHFGWPYCYDYASTSDEWTRHSFICDPSRNPSYRAPHVFLPPHSSPLGILRYSGRMFPRLKDKLLISLHGYRSAGHRLVALNTDPATGLPMRTGQGSYRDDDNSGGTVAFERAYPDSPASTQSEDIIHGWYDAPGYRPRGAPVAITEAHDGSIWIADDKNRALLRLATPIRELIPPGPAPRANFAKAYSEIIDEVPAFKSSYTALVKKVLISQYCEGCHDNYKNSGDNKPDGNDYLRYILAMGNWAIPGDLQNSTLYTKMSPPLKSAMPPIDKAYPDLQTATDSLETVKSFIMTMPKREHIWRIKQDKRARIKGLKKGSPGNSICSELPGDTFVLSNNNNVSILGGQKMLEITIKPNSTLIKNEACKTYDTFYVALDELEKLLN